jgi:hypothetical protein
MGEGAVLETAEFPLLDKPYESSTLAAKLRQVLEPPTKSRRVARGGGGRRSRAEASAIPAAE